MARLPGITGARATHLKEATLRARISDQMMRRTIGHRRTNHVAGARAISLAHPLGQGYVHQAIVAGAARDTMRRTIFTSITLADEDLNIGPSQGRTILSANSLLKLDEALVALQRDVVGHLVRSIRMRPLVTS